MTTRFEVTDPYGDRLLMYDDAADTVVIRTVDDETGRGISVALDTDQQLELAVTLLGNNYSIKDNETGEWV